MATVKTYERTFSKKFLAFFVLIVVAQMFEEMPMRHGTKILKTGNLSLFMITLPAKYAVAELHCKEENIRKTN